jgi:hypothetical protein
MILPRLIGSLGIVWHCDKMLSFILTNNEPKYGHQLKLLYWTLHVFFPSIFCVHIKKKYIKWVNLDFSHLNIGLGIGLLVWVRYVDRWWHLAWQIVAWKSNQSRKPCVFRLLKNGLHGREKVSSWTLLLKLILISNKSTIWEIRRVL